MMYPVSEQAKSVKGNPTAPIRSGTKDLPITSSDVLPLSYRRLVGEMVILYTFPCHLQLSGSGALFIPFSATDLTC